MTAYESKLQERAKQFQDDKYSSFIDDTTALNLAKLSLAKEVQAARNIVAKINEDFKGEGCEILYIEYYLFNEGLIEEIETNLLTADDCNKRLNNGK